MEVELETFAEEEE
jgi:hypothetical protein